MLKGFMSQSNIKVPSGTLTMVCLAVVALKLFFFLRVIEQPELAVAFGDPKQYLDLARGLVFDHEYNNSTRPILFPLIYAAYVVVLADNAPLALVFTQYVLSTVIGWVIYRVLFAFTQDPRKAIVGFCLYVLNPIVTLYESSTFSETFYIFFLSVALLYFITKRFSLSALFFGLASMIRPTGLIIAAIPILFLLFDRSVLSDTLRRVKLGALMALIVAIVVVPWGIRNYHTYDRFFLSNIGEFSLGLYQVNFIYAESKHIDLVQARKEWLQHVYDSGGFDKKYDPPDLTKMERRTGYWEYQNYPDITKHALNEAVRIYLEHPFVVGKFILKGLTLAIINPALHPISNFWGYEIDGKFRKKLIDGFLKFDFSNITKADLKKYANWTLLLSGVYTLANLVLLILVIRNVIRHEVNWLILLMFLMNWFIAGFAGLGGSRYFVAGYPFFIIAALSCIPRSRE